MSAGSEKDDQLHLKKSSNRKEEKRPNQKSPKVDETPENNCQVAIFNFSAIEMFFLAQLEMKACFGPLGKLDCLHA